MAARHTFGIKADVKDNICYLDEQTVIYPSGHNIVIFNTEQKTQKFIPGTENTEGITAMAVSPNHKYVAVAEKAKEGCRTADHRLTKSTVSKRFFACAKCGDRISVLGQKRPRADVRCKCRASMWKKAGMRAERRGPNPSDAFKPLGGKTVHSLRAGMFD